MFGLQWNWLDLVLLMMIIGLAYLPPFRKYSRLPARCDPNTPYQAYCRDFDLEVRADKLDAVLAAAPARDREWAERFPDVEGGGVQALEKDLVTRKPVMCEAAARIRAATAPRSMTRRCTQTETPICDIICATLFRKLQRPATFRSPQ